VPVSWWRSRSEQLAKDEFLGTLKGSVILGDVKIWKKDVIEANKDGYYLALRQTQSTLKEPEPAWHPWLLFLLKALKTQKDRLLSRLDAEQQALATLTPLARSISELLAKQARVSVATIVAATGTSRNTVKVALTRMLQAGLLVRHGSGRSVHYTKR
jgi:DNA-binding transcriptional regulator PaaX